MAKTETAKDQQVNLTFSRDKQTKNKVRFTGENGVIAGSLYMGKDDAKGIDEIKATFNLPTTVS